MTFDENMRDTYHHLATEGATAWDVYAGENSEQIAEEKGISEEQWADARVAMQFGHEIMEEELYKGVPTSDEERKNRVYRLIQEQLHGNLLGMHSDEERRARLLMILQAAQQLNENEVARLAQLETEELENTLVVLTMEWTMDRVLPDLLAQCKLLMQDEEQKEEVLNNAGALAVAAYMNSPQAQQMPEILGGYAGAIDCCQPCGGGANSEDNFLDQLAYALLVISALVACAAVLAYCSSVFASVVAHAMVEHTVAGISAVIAADGATLFPLLVKMLKAALIGGLLGGAVKLLSEIFDRGPDVVNIEEQQRVDNVNYVS